MPSGVEKSIYYFDSCGESHTEEVLKLARKRAEELEIQKVIIASETGMSALRALDILEGFDIIVVTSALGTKVKNIGIGDLLLGITDKKVYRKLEEKCTIVRGTDPFHNINASLNTWTNEKIIRAIMYCIASGAGVCILSTLMATDNGVVKKGEEVVACAGSFVGLDTSCVVKASNSVDLFDDNGLEVLEIICKPRNPKYEWPIKQDKWKGNLEQYKKFTG